MLRKLSLRVQRNYVGDLVLFLTWHGFETLSFSLSPSCHWENLEATLSLVRLLRSPRVGPTSEARKIPRTQRTSVPQQRKGRCWNFETERVTLRKQWHVDCIHMSKVNFFHAYLCAFDRIWGRAVLAPRAHKLFCSQCICFRSLLVFESNFKPNARHCLDLCGMRHALMLPSPVAESFEAPSHYEELQKRPAKFDDICFAFWRHFYVFSRHDWTVSRDGEFVLGPDS